jgi:hypothetical protein
LSIENLGKDAGELQYLRELTPKRTSPFFSFQRLSNWAAVLATGAEPK